MAKRPFSRNTPVLMLLVAQLKFRFEYTRVRRRGNFDMSLFSETQEPAPAHVPRMQDDSVLAEFSTHSVKGFPDSLRRERSDVHT